MLRYRLNYFIFMLLLAASSFVPAEDEVSSVTTPGVDQVLESDTSIFSALEEIVSPARKVDSLIQEKLKVLGVETLEDFIELHMRLEESRNQAEYDLRRSVSEPEQDRLRAQIATLEQQITANESRFEEIATGVNLSLNNESTENLNFTQNLQLLIDPLFKALLQSTEGIRIKADKT